MVDQEDPQPQTGIKKFHYGKFCENDLVYSDEKAQIGIVTIGIHFNAEHVARIAQLEVKFSDKNSVSLSKNKCHLFKLVNRCVEIGDLVKKVNSHDESPMGTVVDAKVTYCVNITGTSMVINDVPSHLFRCKPEDLNHKMFLFKDRVGYCNSMEWISTLKSDGAITTMSNVTNEAIEFMVEDTQKINNSIDDFVPPIVGHKYIISGASIQGCILTNKVTGIKSTDYNEKEMYTFIVTETSVTSINCEWVHPYESHGTHCIITGDDLSDLILMGTFRHKVPSLCEEHRYTIRPDDQFIAMDQFIRTFSSTEERPSSPAHKHLKAHGSDDMDGDGDDVHLNHAHILRPGSSRTVTIISMSTTATVRWKDGTETTGPSNDLKPFPIPGLHYFPRQVVTYGGGKVGIIKVVDYSDEVATVRWLQDPSDLLPYDDLEWEVSMYELMCANYCRPGSGVIWMPPPDQLDHLPLKSRFGHVKELALDGKTVVIGMVDGSVQDINMMDLFIIQMDHEKDLSLGKWPLSIWVNHLKEQMVTQRLMERIRIENPFDVKMTSFIKSHPQLHGILWNVMEEVDRYCSLHDSKAKGTAAPVEVTSVDQVRRLVIPLFNESHLNRRSTGSFWRLNHSASPTSYRTAMVKAIIEQVEVMMKMTDEDRNNLWKSVHSRITVTSDDSGVVIPVTLSPQVDPAPSDGGNLIINLIKQNGVSKEEALLKMFLQLDSAPKNHTFWRRTMEPSPTWIRKVLQEIRLLKENLPDGIWFKSYSDRMDLMSVVIRGPNGTPYEDGLYCFDVQLGDNYPMSPPKVHFVSYDQERPNPNLYVCGKVCLSLLGTWHGSKAEMWNPTSSTLLQLLVSIQGLILVHEPYFNEPGYERSKGTAHGTAESKKYNERIRIRSLHVWSQMMSNPYSPFEQEVKDYIKRVGRVIVTKADWTMFLSRDKKMDPHTTYPLMPMTPETVIAMEKALAIFKQKALDVLEITL